MKLHPITRKYLQSPSMDIKDIQSFTRIIESDLNKRQRQVSQKTLVSIGALLNSKARSSLIGQEVQFQGIVRRVRPNPSGDPRDVNPYLAEEVGVGYHQGFFVVDLYQEDGFFDSNHFIFQEGSEQLVEQIRLRTFGRYAICHLIIQPRDQSLFKSPELETTTSYTTMIPRSSATVEKLTDLDDEQFVDSLDLSAERVISFLSKPNQTMLNEAGRRIVENSNIMKTLVNLADRLNTLINLVDDVSKTAIAHYISRQFEQRLFSQDEEQYDISNVPAGLSITDGKPKFVRPIDKTMVSLSGLTFMNRVIYHADKDQATLDDALVLGLGVYEPMLDDDSRPAAYLLPVDKIKVGSYKRA